MLSPVGPAARARARARARGVESQGRPGKRLADRPPRAAYCACPERVVTLPRELQSSESFSTRICKMATAEPVSTFSSNFNSLFVETNQSPSLPKEDGSDEAKEESNPSPSLPKEDGTDDAKEAGQEIVSPEVYIKHPLQNRWSLWFFKIDKNKTWQANLRLISKFDTVEDFWALYNHIQLSSNLMSGCDYSLFKDGIEPMWEDEKNKRGGRWLITLNKQQRRFDLDRFWLETLLCLVGEAFDDYSDEVCGAVVNIRTKGDKIAVWTSDSENRDAITQIGRVYKERLGLPLKMTIGYQSHFDTATKSGSTTKNKFVV
ncbi:eukaryotic translation initiation factor 4eb [Syngnathus typhle]|uniref:eukaryotic translation initiation factor 4eb n=1 Tax=Syngnathus typhle TaxID=161592 RepID=UPI002A6AF538|nr:eukaryotic translation initiation factor 4eb [Syngnathus typhle]